MNRTKVLLINSETPQTCFPGDVCAAVAVMVA